jgi:hypothetical protein
MVEIMMTARPKRPERKTAPVYRLAAPRVNERALRTMARQFGLSADKAGGTLCSDSEKLVYTEGDLELVMYRASGGIRFRNVATFQRDDGGPDFEISDEAAHRQALAVLKRYQWDTKGRRFLKAARLRVGEMDRERKMARQRTIDVAVALERVVDGLPVDGPGGKTVVYLGRDGEVTGFEHLSREIAERSGEGQLVPPEAAIEHLRRHLRSKSGTVEISDIRFGYFEEGLNSRQRVLQPAYVLTGYTGSPDSRVRRKVVHVAPALERPAARLTPPLRRKPPQSRRPAGKSA